MSAEQERAAILARRDQTARNVRQLIRDAAYYNGLHPNDPPIDVDDDQQTLAKSLASIGLSLDTLRADVAAGEDP